jgi:PhoH-like ATPase
MPLPKAPSKPATLLQPSRDVIARPRKNIPVKGESEPRVGPPPALAARDRPEPAPRHALSPSGAEKIRKPWSPAKPGAAAPAQQHLREPRRRSDPDAAKTFVLDTNVLMHDPSSLFRFEEHDVFVPMMTLEELDNHKKGMSEVARNVRQVTRSLDALIDAISGEVGGKANIGEGIPLSALGHKEATGKLFFQTEPIPVEALRGIEGFEAGKADNQILAVVKTLQARQPDRVVVLVSKDINIRIKAHALGLPAEDYFNDQVIDDADLLYSGAMQLPEGFWASHGQRLESWQQGGYTFYRMNGPLCAAFHVNQFVFEEGATPLQALVQEVQGRTAVLRTLRDYSHARNAVWGITARNREQNFALNLLMNPDIDLVTLLGQAGTGKTLLALAAGLAQILENKIYNEIIVTRATVPLGDDIGFLPGTEEEKMQPWMGALEDNLEVLNRGVDGGGDWGRSAAVDLIRTRIKVKSLNFMRGRTFINKFLIIDEAQNLTPKQMKALITRAGPGTKVVCMGNIAQIDSPYLTEGSSGLTYVVDRFKGWSHGGHVTLQRGERSRLADFATEAL